MLRRCFRYLAYLVVFAASSGACAGSYEDFFRAIGIDDARTVSALLARGFDPNAPSEQGQSGLFLALREGSSKVVDVLLAHPHLKWDAPNRSGETPLMMAALRGNVQAVRRLVDLGAQVDREGWTPLHYAACGTETAALVLLLDRGASIEARSPNGTTPLMMASRYGSEELVTALLQRGASPSARNVQGLDAAGFARLAGRESLMRRLESLSR